ncbi:MAG: hypothetical protein WCD18_16435 [Thermosynechococcaceae cyanobacterium]
MTHSNGVNGTFAENLNVLTEQIGRLTEVVTVGFAEMKDGMTDLKDGMSELKAIVREQAETSKRQEHHISRLVDTVARQAEIVDALIRDRQNL